MAKKKKPPSKLDRLGPGLRKLTKKQLREAAAKGGAATPYESRHFSANPENARAAGSLGGKATPKKKRPFFRDRELAARAGRIAAANRRRRKLEEGL